MGMLKEFKEFAMKGNVVDMAVGVVIAGAFGKIIEALVKDVINPFVGYFANVDFNNYIIPLKMGKDNKIITSLKDAVAEDIPYLGVGSVLTAIANFIIVAFCIFIVVKLMNSSMKKKKAAPAAPAAPPKQEVLLQEIRDLLAKK